MSHEHDKGKPRSERRNFNVKEMESLVFADMAYLANEEGWPYPDTDGKTPPSVGGDFKIDPNWSPLKYKPHDR